MLYIFAEDALQSLQLALEFLAIRTMKPRADLYWLDPADGPGLTRMVPSFLPTRDRTRLTRLLEAEVERWAHKATRHRRRRPKSR